MIYIRTLTWDEPDKKIYESGLDRGVLYIGTEPGVPWNGLVSITDRQSGGDVESLYFNGVKFANDQGLADFSGTLSAYTYPDEFLQCEGIDEVGNGLFITNQPSTSFGLSYRTLCGDANEGLSAGYKIHILYNVTAIPSQKTAQTLSSVEAPFLFEWDLSSVPSEISGFHPSSHFIFDTRKMAPSLVSDLENTLYGDGSTNATLPSAASLAAYIDGWVIIRITDNEDGTWTAEGPDEYFVISGTEFQILRANAKYVSANEYLLSDLTYQ